jgi:hypothetical protein
MARYGAKPLNFGTGLQQPIFYLLLHAMMAREGVDILILKLIAR